MYCGNACKVAAYKLRNPGKVRQSRRKEAARCAALAASRAAARSCKCGARIEPTRRSCDDCQAAKRKASEERAALKYIETSMDKLVDLTFTACAKCGKPAGYQGMGRRRRWCGPCSVQLRREHRRGNREYRRAQKARREARKRGVDAEFVNYLIVFERDGWRCYICRKPTPPELRGSTHPDAPELEHVIPLAAGGPHNYANTACACRSCNIAKGATLPPP